MPLTQSDRLKGAKTSLAKRRQKQQERRKKVKQMFEAGMSKSAISRQLGVDRWTVDRDLKATE